MSAARRMGRSGVPRTTAQEGKAPTHAIRRHLLESWCRRSKLPRSGFVQLVVQRNEFGQRPNRTCMAEFTRIQIILVRPNVNAGKSHARAFMRFRTAVTLRGYARVVAG
jgi:hypothetical protein